MIRMKKVPQKIGCACASVKERKEKEKPTNKKKKRIVFHFHCLTLQFLRIMWISYVLQMLRKLTIRDFLIGQILVYIFFTFSRYLSLPLDDWLHISFDSVSHSSWSVSANFFRASDTNKCISATECLLTYTHAHRENKVMRTMATTATATISLCEREILK